MSVDLTRFFAQRASTMVSWTQFTEDRELISLAGGLPDTTLFDRKLHADVLGEVIARDSALALQYNPTRGLAAARQCAAEAMAVEGVAAGPDDLIITTGGQQVIDLVCRTFLDAGDVVITEAPTYPGALLPFAAYQARVVQVPMDDDGMRMDALVGAIESSLASGSPVKLIYCVPTFQNPSGKTLSLERREQLLQIAASYDLPVLEDNPYGLLRYDGAPLPCLKSLDRDGRVMYLGTFSKVLGPGLRVGWLAAPPAVLDKADLGKQCADLCAPSMSQLFVAAYFARGDWRDSVRRQVTVYRNRRDAMLAALAAHLPAGSAWTRPAGGLFVWVTLPESVDTLRLHPLAARRKMSFVPGARGYAAGTASSELRLSFSACDEERIHEGVRRLGAAVDEFADLVTGRAA